MAPLATSTTSTEVFTAGPLLRKTSRSSRFARFRETAPPTFRLATKPTRSPFPVVTRTKATKRGLTHRRPSRYTRSKSALRCRVGARSRLLRDRLSVKPTGGAAPSAGGGREPRGRPWIASSRESRGSGCAGVDSAGTFFSFRYDSRLTTVRDDLARRSHSLNSRRSEINHATPPRSLCQPSCLAARSRALENFFLSAPTPYARLRPSSGRHKTKRFQRGGVPRNAGFPHLLISLWKSSSARALAFWV